MSKYQIKKYKFSISKNPLLSLENLVRKKLINRYEEPLSFYNVKMINDIIYNERSHYVETFKEYLIYEDINEFLKRFYPLYESRKKLSKILVFYEKYSKIYANYTTLPESKYMYKNIKRKQKMIDNMQNSDEDNSNEEDENSSTEEKIFTTHAMNSINSKTHSLYFNTESKINNSNSKSDISIKNFINKISGIEENANKKKIKVLTKKVSSATNILNTHFHNNNNNTQNNKIKYYFNNNNNSKNKNNNNNNLNKKEKIFNRNIQNLLNINLSKQQLIAILSPYTKLKILNNNNSNNKNNNNNKNKINIKQSNSQHNNLRNNNTKDKNSLTDDKNKFYLGINNKFILSSTCSQSPEVVNERVFSSPSNNKKNIYKNNHNQNKNYNNNNNTSTKRNKNNFINFSNFTNNNNNNNNKNNNNINNNNINNNINNINNNNINNNNNNNINNNSQINNNKLINHSNLINKEYYNMYNIKNYSYRSKLFNGKNDNLKHINGKKFYLPNSSMNNNSTNSMKNISTTNQSNNNNNNIQNSSNKKSNSSSKPKNNNINNKIINNIVNNIQEGSTQINIYTNNELLKSVHLHNASVLNCTNFGNQKSKSPGISNQKGQFNYHNNNKPKFDLNLRKILHKQIFENKNINNNNNNTSERNIVSNNFFEKYGKYFLTNRLDSKIHTTKLNKDKTRILNKNQSQKKLSTKLRADNSCNSIHSGIKNSKFETNNNNLINSRSINIKLANNMNSSTSINNNNNNNSIYNNNNNNMGNITSRALSPYQCIPKNCNFNFNNNNNNNNNKNNHSNINEKIKFKSLHDLSKYLVKINNGNITVLSDKNKKNKITFK